MSRKRCLCCGIHMIIPILSLVAPPQASAITTKDLADICQTMESAFQDISVEHEWSVRNPSIDELPETGTLRLKGPAKRQWSTKRPFDKRSLTMERETLVNERGHSFESTRMQSYNGRTAKQLTSGGLLPDGTAVNISRGTITENRNFMPPANMTPLAFSVLRLSYVNRPMPLSDRLRKSELVHLDETPRQINGFSTVRADLLIDTPLIEPKPPQLRVYFAADHGYTPIKYEYMSITDTGPEPAYIVDVNVLEEVSEGLWFPRSGSTTSVQTNLINTYRATRIVVNQGLTDNHFNIEFPPGIKVYDEVNGLSYVVNAGQDRGNASPQSQNAADTKPMQKGQKPEPPNENQSTHSRIDAQQSKTGTFIYIALGTIFAVIIAVVILKMYR